MARTTIEEVKKIIETALEDDIIQSFIDSANAMLTGVFAGSPNTPTDELLQQMEKWLTAHLLASTREPQIESQEVGLGKVKYAGKTGSGLDSTSYGQTAKLIDPTGRLNAWASKKQITFYTVPQE